MESERCARSGVVRKVHPPFSPRALWAAGGAWVFAAASLNASGQTAQPDPLRFVTSPPVPELKVTLDRSTLVQDVVVEASQQLKDVRVETTRLTGPEIVDLACTIDTAACSTPFDLAAGAAKTVRLTGTVDTAGTYHAFISVTSGQIRRSMTLTVERAETPFPLETAATVETAPAEDAKVSVHVTVQERWGKEATLNVPALHLSRRETGKTALYDVPYTQVVSLDSKRLGSPWTIGKREAKTIVLDISGLTDAGEYVGRVRFTSPATPQVLDVPLLVTVKDGPGLAALLIGLGALLSFLLGIYVRSVRPRLMQQRIAARLESDLATLMIDLKTQFGTLQDAERGVVEALTKRLDDLAADIQSGSAASVDTVLSEIDLKLSLVRRWINARRRAQALVEPPATLAADLESIGVFLGNAGTERATDVQNKLGTVEDTIRSAWQAERTKRLNALREAVNSSELSHDAKAAQLDHIESAAREQDPNKQAAVLERAEAEAATALARNFARRLSALTVPPLGFKPGEWTALKTDTLAKLAHIGEQTEGLRVAAYNTVLRGYLRQTLGALEARAQEEVPVIKEHPRLNSADRKKFSERLEAIQKSISVTKAAVDGMPSAVLTSAIKEVREQLESLEGDLRGRGVTGFMGAAEGEAAAPAAPAPQGLDFGGAFIGLVTGLGARGRRLADLSSRKIEQIVQWLDLAVFLVGLTISILLGLELLWIDNATWGSANDYLIAVLWGLGLHQISNAAFDGISATVTHVAK